jgi:EmrB/QacA subfamily drug resistance transporter
MQKNVKPITYQVEVKDFKRFSILAATLLVLFLSALDALIMAAAMPTIVADLGGLSLYSWVYSAALLSRTVSVPIFGKLADLFKTKSLFMISTTIFLVASVMAGLSTSMGFLIFARVIQGIGAGGNFALVYVILTDVSSPEKRGKALGFAGFVWGIASILGPTLGGLIVTYFSWRWIFFMNIPLGILSLVGIYFFLSEIREKKKKVYLDFAGVFTLSVSILSLLTVFLVGGLTYPWISYEMLGLYLVTLLFSLGFYFAEKRAPEPILSLEFFRFKGFRNGNLAVFLSSFVIFSLFAYVPLFIQGVLFKTPMDVGFAMLSLSLGWSLGSLILGQVIHRIEKKISAVAGAVLLGTGTGTTLLFTTETTMTFCFWTFFISGLGMGFTSLATLLVVQNSLKNEDIGVATSSHQFARTLGGTLGIGICGGLFTARLTKEMNKLSSDHLSEIMDRKNMDQHIENILNPEMLSKFSESALEALRTATLSSLSLVFWIIFGISIICIGCCFFLPKNQIIIDT